MFVAIRHRPHSHILTGAAAFFTSWPRPQSTHLFRNCLSRVQPIEQGLGPLQVERVETFGEAAVDGGQKVVSFGGSPLMGPKFGERGGGSQFPELRLLLLCESDGRFEALFCLSAASGTL